MVRPTDPSALSEFAVELARGAGRLAYDGRRAHFDVVTKSTPTDMVTDVDRQVEAWLIDTILRRRPDDAILGEEGGGRTGTSGVRWILDPIDGTVNFVLGIAQYAVSVAVEIDSRVQAGAVYNPEADELFTAVEGAGAFLNGRRLSGPRAVPLERAVVGTGFGYARPRRAAQATVAAALLDQVADIRRQGSASLDLCALAAGRLDAYYEVGLNPWDWSAGLLVAVEAGCAVSGLRGREPGSQMTAGTRPELAPAFFALLEQLGADDV